jgi:thiamine-monophosphate kinase
MDRSEDEILSAIGRMLSGAGPDVLVGIGDDAAVVRPGSGTPVLAADMLVEGAHFDRGISSPREIGYRAVVVNVSDMAAMAASPRFGLVSLGLSEAVDSAWVIELFGGMREASDEYALSLVGGDLSRASQVVVSIAMTGELAPGSAVIRGGARPGDRLVVTGALGAAAGGLAVARAPDPKALAGLEWASGLIEAYQRPVARVAEARILAAAGATAMIDLSDGLARDLARMCSASGVGARLDLDAIPAAAALFDARGPLGLDPLQLALTGGDDYELLAAMPSEAIEPARASLRADFAVPLAEIGECVEGKGVRVLGSEGVEAPLESGGWEHFAG